MTTTAATAPELSPQPTITTAADTMTLSDGAFPNGCGDRVAMACAADSPGPSQRVRSFSP